MSRCIADARLHRLSIIASIGPVYGCSFQFAHVDPPPAPSASWDKSTALMQADVVFVVPQFQLKL